MPFRCPDVRVSIALMAWFLFGASTPMEPLPPPPRTGEGGPPCDLHVAAIFAAHVVKRMADLPERVRLHRLHQAGEHVLPIPRRLLQ